MKRRPVPILILVALALAAACGASARVKTLRGSLDTVNALRAELVAYSAERDASFIERAPKATSHEELDRLEAEVAAFRKKRDRAFAALLATYAALALASALDDDPSFRIAIVEATALGKAVADLKGKP